MTPAQAPQQPAQSVTARIRAVCGSAFLANSRAMGGHTHLAAPLDAHDANGLGVVQGLPSASPVVSLHNLTVSYRQHPALHHISGSFATGSLTAVVGPNGSGKSTLL